MSTPAATADLTKSRRVRRLNGSLVDADVVVALIPSCFPVSITSLALNLALGTERSMIKSEAPRAEIRDKSELSKAEIRRETFVGVSASDRRPAFGFREPEIASISDFGLRRFGF